MKKSLIISMLMFFVFNLKSQQVKSIDHKFSSEDFFEKSKKQRTTGFILLGGGVAIFTGGVIGMQHSTSKGGREVPFLIGGMAMATASIPFFIASFSSKHKAKFYMNKEALMLTPNVRSDIVLSSIVVKIDFK